ncbi:hypothetical protein sos41_35100 [Alphaproteobacteria bacterium SO-S41]|nr:hypothetical protein sos41_35100 [Alphaproteobacteria bacterium SO-S41]
MKRILILAAALAVASVAQADIPPPAPENPLSEACKPFIGVWTRTTPTQSRQANAWTVLAIDSEGATVLNYVNQQDINVEAFAKSSRLTCVPDDKAVVLTFTDEENNSFSLSATLAGETSFTTTEQTSYMYAGPPDPNWKPEAVLVTWTRIAH